MMEAIYLKLGVALAALLVAGCYKLVFKNVPEDNPVEEIAEEILKEETGIDIDLTPESKEKGEKDGNPK